MDYEYEAELLCEADMSDATKDRQTRLIKRKSRFKARRRALATNLIIFDGPALKKSGVPYRKNANPYKKYHSKDRRNMLKRDLRLELAMAVGE